MDHLAGRHRALAGDEAAGECLMPMVRRGSGR
jgi:hypothetical protein